AHRFRERNPSAPVQQIEIETIGREPRETALAGGDGAFRTRVMRVDLADQKNLVTTARKRTRDDLLGAAIGIHFRGVEQRHAEIETRAPSGDLAGCVTG